MNLTDGTDYLEIGVFKGETFLDVNAGYKIGVDPNFQFDYSAHENDSIQFFAGTSDDYFRQTQMRKFDVIFLDGLHRYEQTLRDFINSWQVAHERTIWLIDDTVPNDNFSALPSQDRCYRLRQLAGIDNWAWMGDVYKVVYFIHAMMPAMSYMTFGGRGQTAVWREKRSAGSEDALALDHISSLTFEDFVETRQNVLNEASDEDIFAAVSAFLSKEREPDLSSR